MSSPALLAQLFERLARTGVVEDIERKLESQRKSDPPAVVDLFGPHGADLTFVGAGLARARRAPVVFVSAKREPSEKHYDDLLFLGFSRVFHYPPWEILPFEQQRPGVEAMSKRLDALANLAGLVGAVDGASAAPEPPVLSTSIDALLQKTVPPAWLRDRSVVVAWGQEIDVADLSERLHALGYEDTPMVEARGEFSVRGGIVDVYPLDADYPFRLDLFGREIESIRRFDIGTQRSLKETAMIERIVLLPANEAQMLAMAARDGVALGTIFDFLPPGTVFVLDTPELFPATTQRFEELVAHEIETITLGRTEWSDPTGAGRRAPEWGDLYLRAFELDAAMRAFPTVSAPRVPMPPAAADTRPRRRVDLHSDTFEDVKPELGTYLDTLRSKQADDYLIAVVCDNIGQVQRLEEILREHEVATLRLDPARGRDTIPPHNPLEGPRPVVLVVGELSSGFIMPSARLLLVTDREMFGRYKRRHVYRKIYKGTPVRAANEIGRGDFVVHIEHGIGRYLGIRRQEIDSNPIDLIEIVYKDDDKLLVPVDKVHYVQKYSAVEGAEPALDKLGGKRWQARKKKSQEQIEAMAKELLELYAAREMAEGHSFGPDGALQQQFEASFLYAETPDQLGAIEQVKSDMESPKPMDRLVCGDVGYGKTEVAIRAAFKAIQDGRQVALLCPTTVLAMQHYNVLRERFADFPVRLEILSRFSSAKETAEALKRVASGEANMVVGTHRLLSNDVRFADLGLVVVDEEQRFGVAHKEKLKRLRTEIDVLTLTATPIPRTLYMALAGLRDMSLISTPPADRYPIRTRTIHFQKEQVEEAILRELNRGGQVFFIHNRVHNIDEVADRLREVVPNARIDVAHGQMADDRLEEVMKRFVEGDSDVLVATTIVENGLDIPNCNTIVINRADALGLAQLYQLRGRVGRSTRQAYAYLIVPEGQPLTEQAVKRLQAIEEFAELGVGFQIAVRDMEIRGTGNILGHEQHGTMEAIGFELYCEMLEEAVREARGGTTTRPLEVEIVWRVASFIPPEFIPIEAQRFALYKQLSTMRSVAQVDELAEEVKDRYGRVPEPVANILDIARLRVLAAQAGATRIVAGTDGFKVEHKGDPVHAMAVWTYMEQEHPGVKKAAFVAGDAIAITVAAWAKGNRLGKAVKLFTAFLESIDAALKPAGAGTARR